MSYYFRFLIRSFTLSATGTAEEVATKTTPLLPSCIGEYSSHELDSSFDRCISVVIKVGYCTDYVGWYNEYVCAA